MPAVTLSPTRRSSDGSRGSASCDVAVAGHAANSVRPTQTEVNERLRLTDRMGIEALRRQGA